MCRESDAEAGFVMTVTRKVLDGVVVRSDARVLRADGTGYGVSEGKGRYVGSYGGNSSLNVRGELVRVVIAKT